ncbi:ribonuclease III [Roseburia hominis]
MSKDIKELQEKIGYHFKSSELLNQALTHSSYVNEHHLKRNDCNERLEFLGDAVLELISSEILFSSTPEMPEGDMTKLRASMVCEKSLAYCARALGLGKYLFLGRGEDTMGGRRRASVISDALEALIGAIYLDGGFANAKEFISRFVMNDLEGKRLFFDSKTILQEMVQGSHDNKLNYQLVKEEGPDHNKVFQVQVLLGDVCYGEGCGRTKKSAEQAAAFHAILKLREGKAAEEKADQVDVCI